MAKYLLEVSAGPDESYRAEARDKSLSDLLGELLAQIKDRLKEQVSSVEVRQDGFSLAIEGNGCFFTDQLSDLFGQQHSLFKSHGFALSKRLMGPARSSDKPRQEKRLSEVERAMVAHQTGMFPSELAAVRSPESRD